MIVVHDIFVCKPGNASKLAKLFKDVMPTDKAFKKVMSDMTGQFNRVIMVSEFASLAAFEKSFDEYKNPTEEMKQQMQKMAGYTDLYLTGSREIYQVW